MDLDSINNFLNNISKDNSEIDCIGLTGPEKEYLIYRCYLKEKRPIAIIVSNQKEAFNVICGLKFFFGAQQNEVPLLYLPQYNILPFKDISYHNEIAAQRISTLYKLIMSTIPPIVVIDINSLLFRLIPKQVLSEYAELIMVDEDIDLDSLIAKLISGGYTRSMVVEESGDFCLRGGILDIFSPQSKDPVRIELFGDTVESIRFFSAVNQRKVKQVEETIILPAREVVLKKTDFIQFIDNITKQASNQNIASDQVTNIIEKIKNQGVFKGIESYNSLIFNKLDTIFDYLKKDTIIFQIEPNKLEKTAIESDEITKKNYLTACSQEKICVDPDKMKISWQAACDKIKSSTLVNIKALQLQNIEKDLESKDQNKFNKTDNLFQYSICDNSYLKTEIKSNIGKESLLLPLVNWLNDKKDKKHTVYIVCSTKSQANRLISLFSPYGFKIDLIENFNEFNNHVPSKIYLCIGKLYAGFIWDNEFFSIITEDEIFDVKYRRKKVSHKKALNQLLAIDDLKADDFVVHDDHGIGQYSGLVKLNLNGLINDFLLIKYQGTDKLYLPIDRMNLIQKYMGVEDIDPAVDVLGGKSWDKIKSKVKKSVEKIAKELLKLYATRKVNKGFSFNKEDSYFKDFEANFSYEETKDQLQAINDVIYDMEAETPMDRLVCGDVGYGKTEVALRAAFVCVNNYKQVAILVPTTVLAEQHYTTFKNRFEKYPVKVACLNRFRTKNKQKDIVSDMKEGKIDIVIGTHRLLQQDIAFKDLGLIIVDEEQRFGVKHKEKLKSFRETVDVLALTATPIPRTLHLSLTGMRDISVISTPPEQRHSIVTYISEFDDAIIKDAIRKEIQRKGQIFFVHNNIYTIWSMAKFLKELVPEVKIGVAHGRQNKSELEKVMIQFLQKEIDMLLCTTIIESGLDIPSANTIIINKADRFGLAQIYQLRGRVGRSDEQAYAYLFIPKDSAIGENAQKRLKVLMEHSDLGAGFQIAMNDLKIRGGGTMLGASQSGHIAAVGYDMFLKLMEKSINELKGEPVYDDLEPEINIAVSCFIPENYITDVNQRLSFYRRLTKLSEVKEIGDMQKELTDRFGTLPDEATNLLLKILLRVLAIKACVKKLDLNGMYLALAFSEMHMKNPFGLVELCQKKPDIYKLSTDNSFSFKLKKGNFNSTIAQTKKILLEIAQNI